MSVPSLVGHGCLTFGFSWVGPMDIDRPSVWRVLALDKIRALKEPMQKWERTVDLIQV
jgi:hypothetical protein